LRSTPLGRISPPRADLVPHHAPEPIAKAPARRIVSEYRFPFAELSQIF